MSVYITVNQVVNLKLPEIKKAEQKLTLIIRNSKTGALLISKLKFNRLDWDEKFKFVTSKNENVEFKLLRGTESSAESRENLLASGKIYINKLMKLIHQREESKQIDYSFKKVPLGFEYQATLFRESKDSSEEEEAGIVKVQVEYDENKQYEGEVISRENLDLREEYIPNPKYVKFYHGKCKKLNLFSFMDEKADGQKFRFIESIYRDFE